MGLACIHGQNRFMLILSAWPSEQVPDKYPTSTQQVPKKLSTDNPYITRIVNTLGNNQLSVKEMLDSLHLKDRENFLKLYLTPAINGGLVKMLYPDSPRHPRQKYLLTGKGQMLLSQLKEK